MKPLLDFLKGEWLGHPLHPILAHVPMAMWPGALIFDLLSQCPIGGNAMVRLSFYAIIFGLAAALLRRRLGWSIGAGSKRKSRHGKSACITCRSISSSRCCLR